MKISSLIKRLQDIASCSGDVEVYIQEFVYDAINDHNDFLIRVNPSSSNTSNIKCNCHEKHGDEISAGGWVCPVHGEQYTQETKPSRPKILPSESSIQPFPVRATTSPDGDGYAEYRCDNCGHYFTVLIKFAAGEK